MPDDATLSVISTDGKSMKKGIRKTNGAMTVCLAVLYPDSDEHGVSFSNSYAMG